MPAPLVAAATYFGLPRLLGALADNVTKSHFESLKESGTSPISDSTLRLLEFVPRQSGLESTLESLDLIDAFRNIPMTPVPGVEEPRGPLVTRELPYGQGAEFNKPMDDFLKYGGRDDDSGMSPLELLRQDFEQDKSYGQTSEPATEVRFDEPQGQVVDSSRQLQGAGFAAGGLADILRMMYAQRQR